MQPRRTRSRLAALAARGLLVVLLCSIALAPQALRFISDGRAARESGRAGVAATTGARFHVRGHVWGLYPGAHKSVQIQVTNPNPYPIRVRSLTATVGRSDRNGCIASALRPNKEIRLKLLVPKKSRAFATYPIKLHQAASNKCQGARWPLVFHGRAVR